MGPRGRRSHVRPALDLEGKTTGSRSWPLCPRHFHGVIACDSGTIWPAVPRRYRRAPTSGPAWCGRSSAIAEGRPQPVVGEGQPLSLSVSTVRHKCHKRREPVADRSTKRRGGPRSQSLDRLTIRAASLTWLTTAADLAVAVLQSMPRVA